MENDDDGILPAKIEVVGTGLRKKMPVRFYAFISLIPLK
jgi:hypothetical protein